MALTMRPTGLSSGFYKDSLDYSIFCGEWFIGRIYETYRPSLALRINTTHGGRARCSTLPMQMRLTEDGTNVRAPALSGRLDRVSSLVL